MNNTVRITVLSALSLALVCAQGRGHGRMGPGGGTPPTTAEMVQMKVDGLTRRLTLTEAQQNQAKTIFTQAATASEAPRASLKAASDAIRAAVKSNDVGTINSQSLTFGTLSGNLMAIEQRGGGPRPMRGPRGGQQGQ